MLRLSPLFLCAVLLLGGCMPRQVPSGPFLELPDGHLVRVDKAENGTSLLFFETNGAPVRSVALPLVDVQLAQSERGDLLAYGHALKRYSFGANLKQVLIQVTREGQKEMVLFDTTIKPHTVNALGDHLKALLPLAFSPAGDELVYLRLHDPPEFPAYLQLVHRNWQVGGERLLGRLPVVPLTLRWHDESRVEVSRDGVVIQELNVWPPILSPSKGTRGDVEKAWTLRRWRFEGLISPEEYRDSLTRGMP